MWGEIKTRKEQVAGLTGSINVTLFYKTEVRST